MKFILYLLLCSTTTCCISVANAQYKGGSYDGFDAISIVQLSNTNVAYMGGSGDGFAIVSTDPALPVTFGSFTAVYQRQTNAVQLEWQTLTELNTSYFLVQQSIDNTIWATLQQVTAKGNSTVTQSYKATHANPSTGRNLYRIITVDRDGQKNISPVRMITINSDAGMPVVQFSNPVRDVLKLQIIVQQNDVYSICLIQANGVQVSQQQVQLGSGASNLSFDLRSKPAGIYYVVIKNQKNTTTQTVRVVKL